MNFSKIIKIYDHRKKAQRERKAVYCQQNAIKQNEILDLKVDSRCEHDLYGGFPENSIKIYLFFAGSEINK